MTDVLYDRNCCLKRSNHQNIDQHIFYPLSISWTMTKLTNNTEFGFKFQRKTVPNVYREMTNNRRSLSSSPLKFSLNLLFNYHYLLLCYSSLILISVIAQQSSMPNNNLPLLTGTLRTYQVSSCDNEDIKLECDSQTVVSIVLAKYGQTVPQKFMCRSFFQQWRLEQQKQQKNKRQRSTLIYGQDYYDHVDIDDHTIASTSSLNHIAKRSKPSHHRSIANQQCLESYHLSYKFLIKIEETCREQHHCSLKVNPLNFGFKQDPCGHQLKYAEVAYKCRPNQFINKIICEDKSINLQCNNDDRLIIFKAEFGSTWSGVSECPGSAISTLAGTEANLTIYEQLCHDSFATETVMKYCHGKRNCTIMADLNTFTNVKHKCSPRLRYYLKLVYTCISKKMINTELAFVDKDDHKQTTSTTTIAPGHNFTSTTTINRVESSSSLPTKPIKTNLINDDDNDDGDDHGQQQRRIDKTAAVSQGVALDKTALVGQHHQRPNDNILNRTINTNTRLMMDSSSYPSSSKPSLRSSSQSPQAKLNGIGGGRLHNINCTELTAQMQVVGFVSDWISAIGFVKKNKERFILYLLVSLFGSMVCFLTVLSARLYYQKNAAVKKVRQEQTLMPQFDFDNDPDDEEDDDDDDDDCDYDDEHGHHQVDEQHQIDSSVTTVLPQTTTSSSLPRQTTATTLAPSIVGLRDYNSATSIKRQSTATAPAGFSTIRRPRSGSILALEKHQQQMHYMNKPMISTLGGRNRHPHHHYHLHAHHQHKQQQPQPPKRYSTTTIATSRDNNNTTTGAIALRGSTTPNMTGTMPKSILRDSGVQTATPPRIETPDESNHRQQTAIMMMMPPPPPSATMDATINSNGQTTMTYSPIGTNDGTMPTQHNDKSNDRISAIDLIPSPPPPMPSLLTSDTTGILKYQKYPKFPVIKDNSNDDGPFNTTTPTTYNQPTTTNSSTTPVEQDKSTSPSSSILMKTNQQPTTSNILILNDVQHPKSDPTKILSSGLANFLV